MTLLAEWPHRHIDDYAAHECPHGSICETRFTDCIEGGPKKLHIYCF